jgi:AcrR family transcriptional regulator
MTKQVTRNTREIVLEHSVALFAGAGFHGVSMRDIAAGVGVTPAALYHHFPDKEQLYLGAVSYAFEERMGPLKALLEGQTPPWERLEAFVTQLAALLGRERDYLRLMQWVMLDDNEQRQRQLAASVFRDMFGGLSRLAAELAPQQDPHLLVVTLVGMVVFPFEALPVQRFMPDYRGQLETPEAIARQVIALLRGGLCGAVGRP